MPLGTYDELCAHRTGTASTIVRMLEVILSCQNSHKALDSYRDHLEELIHQFKEMDQAIWDYLTKGECEGEG